MTRTNLLNNLKANTTENNNGAFAVILYKKNFYTKKVFTDIITTTNTYEEAKVIKNELATKFINELKECEAQVTFVTVDALTRGYSYKFAKQS